MWRIIACGESEKRVSWGESKRHTETENLCFCFLLVFIAPPPLLAPLSLRRIPPTSLFGESFLCSMVGNSHLLSFFFVVPPMQKKNKPHFIKNEKKEEEKKLNGILLVFFPPPFLFYFVL